MFQMVSCPLPLLEAPGDFSLWESGLAPGGKSHNAGSPWSFKPSELSLLSPQQFVSDCSPQHDFGCGSDCVSLLR